MNFCLSHSRWSSVSLLLVALTTNCVHCRSASAQTPPLPPFLQRPQLPEISAADVRLPLAASQQVAVDKALAFLEQAKICKTPIDLKMTDTTLDYVLARIKQEPAAKNIFIEVRDDQPVRLSFDLKRTKIGSILDIVAGLVGGKFYMQKSGLLISPESKLSPAELQDFKSSGGEWIQSDDGDGGKWTAWRAVRVTVSQAVAQDITGKPVAELPTGTVSTTLDKFSPKILPLVRLCADAFYRYGPHSSSETVVPQLDATSPVMVDIYSPDVLSIRFVPLPRPASAPPQSLLVWP